MNTNLHRFIDTLIGIIIGFFIFFPLRESLPPFVSIQAFSIVIWGNIIFALLHEFRGKSSKDFKRMIIIISDLFHLVPYIVMIFIIATLSIPISQSNNYIFYIIYGEIAVTIHREWNWAVIR